MSRYGREVDRLLASTRKAQIIPIAYPQSHTIATGPAVQVTVVNAPINRVMLVPISLNGTQLRLRRISFVAGIPAGGPPSDATLLFGIYRLEQPARFATELSLATALNRDVIGVARLVSPSMLKVISRFVGAAYLTQYAVEFPSDISLIPTQHYYIGFVVRGGGAGADLEALHSVPQHPGGAALVPGRLYPLYRGVDIATDALPLTMQIRRETLDVTRTPVFVLRSAEGTWFEGAGGEEL